MNAAFMTKLLIAYLRGGFINVFSRLREAFARDPVKRLIEAPCQAVK
jgi:hypothetical protein